MPEREINLLVVDSAEGARKTREMLAGAEEHRFSVHCAETLVSALDALARLRFDIVLLELALPDSDGLATFETIRLHTPGLPVVIHTGTANELLALNAVQRGAQDYLTKGRMSAQALVRVLQYALARHQGVAQSGQPDGNRAKVTGILGAKGGVGATSLACQYSLELKRQAGGRVLLLDLDPSSASSAFLLKTESKYSVSDAATNLHRLDETFWNGVVANGPDGVHVLQSPGAAGNSMPVSGERLRHVLRFVKTLYDFIVLDLGRLGPLSMNLIEETAEIYLVTTSGMPEMYEAGRVLRKLTDLGWRSENLHILFNRVRKSGMSSIAGFQKALAYPVYCALSDCPDELESAFAEGRWLDEGLTLRKQMGQLVARSLGVEEKQSSRGLFGLLNFARA